MLNIASANWAKCELFCSASCCCAVTLLMLLNVITRTIGSALFWVDELAIYTMVWMTFLGASAALHYRQAISVTVVTDLLSQKMARITAKLVDLIIFVFALFMVWCCWRWFSPLVLFQSEFDFDTFQRTTFNFVYAEPTSTLGISKYPIWLVMWQFALGATLHSLAHLLEFSHDFPNKSDSK